MILVFLLSLNIQAKELQETFVVTLFDKYVKVVSPDKFHNKLSIIIENKSLVKVHGKVDYDSAKESLFVAVFPNETRTVEISPEQNDKIVFIPQAPPFQEVELIFGRKSYEIPPQK